MTAAPILSIVIPVYREPLEIVRALAWLDRCHNIRETEIIIVDGDAGSSLTPPSPLPVRVITSPPGRGLQLNAGAKEARASLLAFLHVDTRPPRGFVRAIASALNSCPAGAFDLHIETGHPLVRATSLMGLLRSRLTRVPYGDQVQFITRDLFERIGGFPEEPLMEDVALMDRIAAAGERIAILRPPAVTSGRRWVAEGAARGTLRNWRIMLAYRSGISPATLRQRYRPQSEFEQKDALIVFHRALRPGHVKTRLAASVGAASALDLYRAMVLDARSQLRFRSLRTIPFVDTPTDGEDLFKASIPQTGADLWDRMNDALARARASGSRRIVLIGSDIPGISRHIVLRAFALLRRNDFVIGPSGDGGFYLIGTTAEAFDSDLLKDAALNPDRSRERIIEWATGRKRAVAELPQLTDVDTVEDLHAVLADTRIRGPFLRRAARRLRLLPR